jgi:hypothetical protein
MRDLDGVPSHKLREFNYGDPEALRDLIATLWLYIGRRAEQQLTTEQKELLADVVEGYDEAGVDEFDRWWRDA